MVSFLYMICIRVSGQQVNKIYRDSIRKEITLSNGIGNLVIRIGYSDGCFIDRILVNGVRVGSAFSGIKVGDRLFSSRSTSAVPQVIISGDSVLVVNNIVVGDSAFPVREDWVFHVKESEIDWRIRREYTQSGSIEESDFPCWKFKSMDTWEGALLDNGGVAWNRLLDKPGDTYGCHAGALTFWSESNDNCLRITPMDNDPLRRTAVFRHEKDQTMSVIQSVSPEPASTKSGFRRFLTGGSSVFNPFSVDKSQVTAVYRLQAFKWDSLFQRGLFPGMDAKAMNEMLNTIGRYGVVDRNLYGSNGWRSGYVVLQEPWLGLLGLAVDAPEFIKGYSDALAYEKGNAIQPDGRVLPRWHQDASDAMPNTYGPTGFYECQWGYMLDSQPAFAIDVADQFAMTGDLGWLREFKSACEKALGYMIGRFMTKDGLFRVVQSSHRQHQGCDWMDVVWASYKVASINAYMYRALEKWSELEMLLGDKGMSRQYRSLATHLKTSFNKSVSKGGFWDEDHGCYAYWREEDGSVYGNNWVTMINFLAIGYGLCDDLQRKRLILDKTEELMKEQNLFIWPSCFFPYGQGLGLQGVNYPFPNYENGDLFLAWAELGIRCYAEYRPNIALKYIHNVIEKYRKDGLAFQRYARSDQTGRGDDILSNNVMAIVGLYRDIYGINPQYNRLYLNPHLPSALNNTYLNYWLRGRTYGIYLSGNKYTVHTGGFSISGNRPFGLSIDTAGLRYFNGDQASCSLRLSAHVKCTISIERWDNELMIWSEKSPTGLSNAHYTVYRLVPNSRYRIATSQRVFKTMVSDPNGKIAFNADIDRESSEIEIRHLR